MPHGEPVFAGAILSGMLVTFLLAWVLGGAVFYLALRWAGIRATLFKAMLAVLAGTVIAFFVAKLLVLIPVVGILLAPFGYFVAFAWVVKEMFDTSWERAFLSLILVFVIQVVLFVALALLTGVSMMAFLTTCPLSL
ncbi:hypothetical protein [Geoglobus ahangari]